uniref:aldehyde dehydrogenase family protein n=1 Tax=uncultured Sphingomonas sp. TaxID=158754 RepID=UPI002610F5C7
MRDVQHFIGGGAGAAASRHGDIFNPNNGQVQARVPLGDRAVLDAAVAAAQKAQPEWAATNPQRRSRVLFEYKRLVEL